MGGERKQGHEKQRKRFFPKKAISLISPRISLGYLGNMPLISSILLHNQGGKIVFAPFTPAGSLPHHFGPWSTTSAFIPFFPDFVPKRLIHARSPPHLGSGTAGGREETTASTLKSRSEVHPPSHLIPAPSTDQP